MEAIGVLGTAHAYKMTLDQAMGSELGDLVCVVHRDGWG
jgi:hypothetical protein